MHDATLMVAIVDDVFMTLDGDGIDLIATA